MKVGFLQFFSWLGRRGDLAQVYESALDRVHIMDENDYDAVWIAEHHFSTYSVCPSIHMMGVHFANHTRRLRIGTGVSLAAFYHPLRLAEEVALLDIISGGRVNWGVGSGFDPREFAAFGVDREQRHARFRENVDVVLRAWSSEKLDFQGEFQCYEAIEVLPKPTQSPIPVWMAASSPEAVTWAAQQGHSIMMDPHSSIDQIADKYSLYRQEMMSHGHDPEGRDTPVARLLAIAPTDEAAEAVARRGAEWTTGGYAKGAFADGKDPVSRYVDDVIVWGCPERVADELIRFREEKDLNYLLCSPLSNQSFALFNEEVLPRLR